MDGSTGTAECDVYFAFSIGDQEYLTFVTDFDGMYDMNASEGDRRLGIFVYPPCGSSSIASGDASAIYPSASDYSIPSIRDAITGGDDAQAGELSSTATETIFQSHLNL